MAAPASPATQAASAAVSSSNLNLYKSNIDYLMRNTNPRAYCFTYLAGASSLGTGSFTTVALDTEITDSDGMHTGSNGFFTVVTAGLYDVRAQITFPSTTTGTDAVQIAHTATGGGSLTSMAVNQCPFLSGFTHRLSTSIYLQCAVGDVITLQGFSSSTTVTVTPASGSGSNIAYNTYLQALLVSN